MAPSSFGKVIGLDIKKVEFYVKFEISYIKIEVFSPMNILLYFRVCISEVNKMLSV